ncbi:hypothetical protein M7I_8010 [Glarea lozoyensis 74030]|uniref:Aminoglycoside phosphotransferase domain-containing protein n=1 Tax=Glarea lozoyensis (strain ATCC 74030 / MF5533) TaxID=1104152 RepID=H0EYV0_GLAL7|nr:hypothetical protein M7I_8010 [Glarea lozoyensis 74030]
MASPSEAPIAEGVDQSIPDHETNAVTTATSPSQEKASGDQQIAPVSEPVVSLSPCEEDDDDFPSNCLDDEEWSDQEPFESLREKVNQLCQDIGFGEPSEILEMGGGDFHRIVGLRFSSRTPQRYILRIPRWAYSEDLQHETSDQVAILSFFSRKFKDVPVPSVYAYDSTTNNAIENLDDAKSAPRVLTRKPPSWLWIHPDTRHSTWMGDHDDKPERPFTHDELLIKAHFDQTMAQLCPSYLEDAYHRGYWLRRLSRFAVLGLESAECINRFWTLSEEWDQYYQALELDDVDVKMTDAMDEGSGENSEENLSK